MTKVPTNNERNPNHCDACGVRINAHDECACLNNGGVWWGLFHLTTDDDSE